MLPDLLQHQDSVRLVRGRYGLVAYNPHDSVIGRSIECYGEYFESEVAIFRQILRPGDLAVDIGANIGTHSLAMARLVGPTGRVIAFEPQRPIFHLLTTNLALNGLGHALPIQAALGASQRQILVPEQDFSRAGNFGGLELGGSPQAPTGRGSAVIQMTLDAITDCRGARLIKIDVEGMENAVLAGGAQMLRRDRPWLYVENDRIQHSPQLIRTLWDLNYRLYWHFAPFFNPENFAGNPISIERVGYMPGPAGLYLNGIATNLLARPSGETRNVIGLIEVRDAAEHPLAESDRDRLTPGIPLLR